jgi:hypothetical protein
MAATIVLMKCTGAAAATENDVTSVGVRLTSVDDHSTAPASAPITIPTSGTAYSYETQLRFKCTVAPDNQCTNFQVWSLGTAIQTGAAKITLNSTAVTAGVTPVNTVSSAGTRTDLVVRTSGSKVAVAGTLTASGNETDYVVLQLEVYSSATQGNVTQSNEFNYSYDEN